MQMQKAIIGKKVGMTQIFDESGKVIPVTVIEAGPCVVTQGPASMTVTGMTLPISSKICVMPTFLPIMAFFIRYFLLRLLVASLSFKPEAGNLTRPHSQVTDYGSLTWVFGAVLRA